MNTTNTPYYTHPTPLTSMNFTELVKEYYRINQSIEACQRTLSVMDFYSEFGHEKAPTWRENKQRWRAKLKSGTEILVKIKALMYKKLKYCNDFDDKIIS